MPSRELRSPIKLLTQLLKIEQDFGRERRVRWDARTLDLDLLSYGNVILKNHDLVLPHPRMLERAFVLAPLCEIAPDWTHPVTQKLACESLSQLGRQEVKQTDLTWNLDQG